MSFNAGRIARPFAKQSMKAGKVVEKEGMALRMPIQDEGLAILPSLIEEAHRPSGPYPPKAKGTGPVKGRARSEEGERNKNDSPATFIFYTPGEALAYEKVNARRAGDGGEDEAVFRFVLPLPAESGGRWPRERAGAERGGERNKNDSPATFIFYTPGEALAYEKANARRSGGAGKIRQP